MNNAGANLFSFILVNYNTPKYTWDCIASITQTPGNYEIIVVDNSEKPVGLEELEAKYRMVSVVRSGRNLGFTGGNNYGAHHAKGEYLVILNNDTVVQPGSIGRMPDILARYGIKDLVTGYIEKPNGHPQISCGRFPSVAYELLKFCVFIIKYIPLGYAENFQIRTWEQDVVQQVDWCTGAFFIIRRSFYQDLGGFDENIFMYMDDVDLHKRVYRHGGRILYHPELRITHFAGQSSRKVGYKAVAHQYRSTVYYFKKHHGVLRAIIFVGGTKTIFLVWEAVFLILSLLSFGTVRIFKEKLLMYRTLIAA